MRLLVTSLYLPFLYAATVQGGLTATGAASVIGALMLFAGQLWLVLRWYRRTRPVGIDVG